MAKQQNSPETAQGSLTGVNEPGTPNITTITPSAPASPQSAAPAPATLTDAEKEGIKKLVAASSGRKFGLNRLPGGSFRLDVTIPVEIAAALESQAECAGEPLEVYLQNTIVEALQAYTWASAT